MHLTGKRYHGLVLLLLAGLIVGGAHAAGKPGIDGVPPAVSIIIDDMGHRLDLDLRIIDLPGAVTCSFLPRSPHARRLASLAHQAGKEVMLHLPMQAMGSRRLDEGGLQVSMSRTRFADTVQAGLASLPHVRGVNNHMGSLLTQYRGRMQWLMDDLRAHDGDLYFVDSYTTFMSVAHAVAAENALPSMRRDVFLDADRDPAFIEQQFHRLIRTALDGGTAIAIGHPYPETLDFLEQNLDLLEAHGIELLPVSSLIERQRALSDTRVRLVLAEQGELPRGGQHAEGNRSTRPGL